MISNLNTKRHPVRGAGLGGMGRVRGNAHAVRCAGKRVWKGLRVSHHEKLQGDFSDSVTAIQDGDGGEVKGAETVVRQNAKAIIA